MTSGAAQVRGHSSYHSRCCIPSLRLTVSIIRRYSGLAAFAYREHDDGRERLPRWVRMSALESSNEDGLSVPRETPADYLAIGETPPVWLHVDLGDGGIFRQSEQSLHWVEVFDPVSRVALHVMESRSCGAKCKTTSTDKEFDRLHRSRTDTENLGQALRTV